MDYRLQMKRRFVEDSPCVHFDVAEVNFPLPEMGTTDGDNYNRCALIL
jgi:hypothetical protein